VDGPVADIPSDIPSGGPARAADQRALAVVDEAGSALRAPWAASVAGLLFALLFTGFVVLVRSTPVTSAGDVELVRIFATGGDLPLFIGGTYLAPFAGVMFLWFIAVIRDQVGEREDKFFGTVFFGSGLLFIALEFVAAAVISSVTVGVRFFDNPAPTATQVGTARALGYTFLFMFSTRAAAVCVISIATLGLRSRTFPRWFALTGYLLGLALFIVVAIWDWIMLALPAWVAVVSLFILRRERARTRSAAAGGPPPVPGT
jgi:hypothetical protein